MNGGFPHINWGDRGIAALVGLTAAIGVVFLFRALPATELPTILVISLAVYVLAGLNYLLWVNHRRAAALDDEHGWRRHQ